MLKQFIPRDIAIRIFNGKYEVTSIADNGSYKRKEFELKEDMMPYLDNAINVMSITYKCDL